MKKAEMITEKEKTEPFFFPTRKIIAQSSWLTVLKNSKGRGVYMNYAIAEGEEVERCPIIAVTNMPQDRNNPLHHYVWGWKQGVSAIALGYCGSLLNHSSKPNVTVAFDFEFGILIFKTIRDIEAGEELLVSYGHNYMEIVDTGDIAEGLCEMNTVVTSMLYAQKKKWGEDLRTAMHKCPGSKAKHIAINFTHEMREYEK